MSEAFNDFERSAAFLQEMGLGPLWVRRAVPAVEAVTNERAREGTDEGAHALATRSAPDVVNVAAVPAPEAPASALHEAQTAVTEASENSEAAWPEHSPQAGEADALPAPAREAPLTIDTRVAEMDWEALEQAVSACTRCDLCHGRTRTVFGTGERRVRWLFIGEGPGREEDLRGEPFVGRAGQLLDNMLAALGLDRADSAYIANIVKCRPTDAQGKDRRPSPEEAASCLPYLKRQIELIQPQVIVALGKTAAVSLLDLDPETPVGSLRGKVHRYLGRPLIVTYHPAYLLRTPADKKKAWGDLCLARESLADA